jgi:GNAT superfamily N-acetyltransferase
MNVPPYHLRPHTPDDLEWVVRRHREIYSRDYGLDHRFAALVANVVADFADNFDPAKECGWIAEIDGVPVGCVFVMKGFNDAAKLRLLLVEPEARGMGLGRRLVDECVQFARRAGYAKMVLWTHDVLTAAIRIYQRAGFRLVHCEKNSDFGPEVGSQIWELEW